VHAWFRLRGLLLTVARRDPVRTAMPRTGFSGADDPAHAAKRPTLAA
jgi:hypothetical protein